MFIIIPIKFKNENPQVSPEGLHFTNKARAINGVVEIGGRRDEIAALMDLYRLEGWIGEGLPKGWIGKCEPGNKYGFINEDGSTFVGKNRAIAYILQTGGSREEQRMLEEFASTQPMVINKFHKEDKPVGQTLPQNQVFFGSRSTVGQSKMPVLSNLGSGQIYQHTLPSRTSKIEENLNGWSTNPYLPQGWLCHKTQDNNIRLYTSEGVRLRSYKTAAEYMMQNANYNQHDINRLYLYPEGKENSVAKQNLAQISAELGLKLKSIQSSQSFDPTCHGKVGSEEARQEEQQGWTPQQQNLPGSREMEDWKENEFLPPGWRCRPNKHGNISLLTVDNVKIKSYKGAVDFMLEHDDYSQEDIDRVQMYPDGLRRALHGQAASVEWSTSVYLPPGWR